MFFNSFYRGKDHIRSECKRCTARMRRNTRKKNGSPKQLTTPEAKAKRRKYYQDHWDAYKEARDKFYQANPNYFKDRYALQKRRAKLKIPQENQDDKAA